NFMSKDRGGKLKMEPIWDWNLSFGNAHYAGGELTNGWYSTPENISENQHIWLRRLLQDSNFVQRVVDRWSELRGSILAPSNILARMDQIAGSLDEAQARDFARWPRLGTYVWPNPA